MEEIFLKHLKEVHEIAVRLMNRQEGFHTLQPTALLNQAWLRLAKEQNVSIESKPQLIALAIETMENLLKDSARARNAKKRGGDWQRVTITITDHSKNTQIFDILDLHDALEELKKYKPKRAQMVKLRIYGGLTNPEIAEVMGVNKRTVVRWWSKSKSFLKLQLKAYVSE